MTDRRSAFRFRLRPSVPPPRPATARRPTIRPQGAALPSAPSPSPPPPIPPQDTPPARPLPVVQPLPQAPPLPIQPQPPTLAQPQQEPAALPPTVPIQPLGTVPASPPEPLVEPTTATQDKTPSPAPISPPMEPIHPLEMVPSSPPVEPSAASIPPKPTQAAPSSPLHSSIMPQLKTDKPQESTKTESQLSSQSRVSAKQPPPSQASSPPRVQQSQPPSPPSSPVLNATPTTKTNEEIHNEAFKEVSSEHSNSETHVRDQPRIETEENQHESDDTIGTTSNIPKTPQTKSMISVQESPKHTKPNGPEAVPYCGETICTNLPNHESNEKSPSVITLAGENRGTTMHIGSSATKTHWKIHIRRKYKVNPDEITDTTTDGEESCNEKKRANDLKPNENKENAAYISCNIQGINNSMVYDCSITESNPGFHFGSSSNPKKKTKRNKVKVNITPSQSSKHTIRRRCLRGLFMESSSDSDPNNPQKPRRHGCRYISNKDDKMDVV